ncbi:hypothetical protein BJV78DRAFT_372997 [Lactifluus subvellereus]|nr:hypothetical protein BJV78DRAFT_372997 [Lactifluus subvellereus]
MLINKRDSQSPLCTPISPSIRLCWVDILVISLILLVVAYFLLGIPLTACLCKIVKGKGSHSSPSSIISIPLLHMASPQRSRYPMSPRRQDSEETLFDGSSNGSSGFDKLDFETTAHPPPTHNAHDIQGPPPLVCRRDNTTPRTRSHSDTSSIPQRPKSQQRGSLSGDMPVFSSEGSRMSRDKKFGESRETNVVPLPPAAYTPLPVGQGRRAGSYDGAACQISISLAGL